MAGFFKSNAEPVQHFRNRVLPLHTYYPIDGKPDHAEIDPASGFLARVGDTVWIFTAGHVIEDILKARALGKLVSLQALDAWTATDGTGMPVVIPRDCEVVKFGTNEIPPDVGAIRLDTFTAGTFNPKMEPVPESHWDDQPVEFDYYLVLGGPKELVKVSQGSGNSEVRMFSPPAVARCEKIARPDYSTPFQLERFYGQLVPTAPVPGEINKTVKNIVGVSGGPILGCKVTNDGICYWVIGVQSGWKAEYKTIVADSAPSLFAQVKALSA